MTTSGCELEKRHVGGLHERPHLLSKHGQQQRVRPLLHLASQRGGAFGPKAQERGVTFAAMTTPSVRGDALCAGAWSQVAPADGRSASGRAAARAAGGGVGRANAGVLPAASLSGGGGRASSLAAPTNACAVGGRAAAAVGVRARSVHTSAARCGKGDEGGDGDGMKPPAAAAATATPTKAGAGGGEGGGQDGGGRKSRKGGGKGVGKGGAAETNERAAAAAAAAAATRAPSAASPASAQKGGGVGAISGEGVGSAGGSGGGSGAGGVVGDLPHQVSELYVDLERKLMSRVHAQDKNRFRAVGLSSTLLMIWVLSMFGTEIRRYFASQTAEVARETLKVEALQVQTQELATALVQALLNDQEVVSAGALFLREASANPETQGALISLALYVLLHPDTLAETKVLAKKLVRAILDDPDTVQQVTDMALNVMRNPRFRQGASELVVALGQSEEVYAAVTDLASRVIQDPEVQATLSVVLSASSREVLQDQEVFDHSKEFVAQVMGDDAVQRSGGDALWNTMQYALQTRLFKATGLCILCAGTAVLFSGRGGRDFGGWGGGGGGSK